MVNRGYVEPKSDKPQYSKRNPLQRNKPTFGPFYVSNSGQKFHTLRFKKRRPLWQNFGYFQQNSLKHWQLSVNWICPGHFPDILSQKLNNTIILLAQRYKSNSWLYNFLGLESVLQCSILNCQKSFLKFTFVDYQAFSSFCWRNIATLISWVHYQCYFSAWYYFSIFRQRILH